MQGLWLFCSGIFGALYVCGAVRVCLILTSDFFRKIA